MKPRAQRVLDRIVALPLRWPRRNAFVAVALFAIAILSVLRVQIDPNVEELLGSESARTHAELSRVFGWRDRIYLLLESQEAGRGAELVACAREIGAHLESSQFVHSVEFGPPAAASRTSLLFPFGLVLIDDAARVEELLTAEGMTTRLEQQLEVLSLPGLGEPDEFAADDPLGIGKDLASRLSRMRSGYRFAPSSPYFVSEDGRALLVVVQGGSDDGGSLATSSLIESIESAAAAAIANAAVPGITVRGTGRIYLADESQRMVSRDLTLSLSASIAVAALLLALGLRMRIGAVLALCVPTIWGAVLGLGAFVAVRGTVSALSFACAAILIGLGIDFTIHVTTAALSARSRGAGPARALLRSLRETRGRLVLAALTSTAAFLAFLSSETTFLREMGLLTAFGLMSCVLSPFVVLPPILLRNLARSGSASREPVPFQLMRLVALAVQRRRLVLWGTSLPTLAAIGVLLWQPPRFEDDLRNLHAADSAPLATQQRLGEVFGGSFEPLLLIVRGEAEFEVVERSAAVERELAGLVEDGTLASVSSIAGVIPSRARQQRTLEVFERYGAAATKRALHEALENVGFEVEQFGAYIDGLARSVALDRPIVPADLRAAGLAELVDKFVRPTPDGDATGLVVLQPREELWSGGTRREVLQRVARAIERAGVPAVLTGMHPTAVESADHVAAGFTSVSLWTVLAVVTVVFLRFRRPRTVLMVLAPAALGAVWVAAFFSLTGQRLNLMNVGVIPMVLALGIDDGIHVVGHFLAQRRRDVAGVLRATGTGILLTSVTTMVTFGSLGLSSSRGLASVGTLSFVGIGCCLVASVLLLPALMTRRQS